MLLKKRERGRGEKEGRMEEAGREGGNKGKRGREGGSRKYI